MPPIKTCRPCTDFTSLSILSRRAMRKTEANAPPNGKIGKQSRQMRKSKLFLVVGLVRHNWEDASQNLCVWVHRCRRQVTHHFQFIPVKKSHGRVLSATSFRRISRRKMPITIASATATPSESSRPS